MDCASMVSLHDDCIYFVSAPGQHAAEADKSSTLNQVQFESFKNYKCSKGEDRAEGPPNKALPAKKIADELSCIFTSEMIDKYDQLNHQFTLRMGKTSWPRDLADLILLDIQFRKGCEVESKSTSHQPPPAVSTLGRFPAWSCRCCRS